MSSPMCGLKEKMMTLKFRSIGLKLCTAILLLTLVPAAAHAAGAVVDCSGCTPPPAFTSISAALASLPAAGPNSISVIGTCNETVIISGRTDLTIFGNPTATVTPTPGNRRGMVILQSRRISIQNIVFDGGRGVFVNDQSRVDFTNITIQNSTGIGLTSLDSLVHIADSTIK